MKPWRDTGTGSGSNTSAGIREVRILIVQDTDWIRRNPIQHNHLAERLVKRGHEVRVIDYEILWRTEGKRELISRRQVFHLSRIIRGAAITVIRPGILKIPLLDYVSMLFTYHREIKRQIREFKPQVIISNDILSTYLSYHAAKKPGIPTVYYIIDVEYKLVPFAFLRPLGRVIEAKNISHADLVIAISEGLRDYATSLGAKPEKTLVLRAGIDMKRYEPGISGIPTRKKYGLSRHDTVLFFMGWLYPFSGLKEVATELAKKKDANIKLLIVGDGDGFTEIERAVAGNGVQNQVVLAGRQPYEAIPELIASADICLLPARNNGVMRDIVPIKMYEYLAMGKPVIATRLPGVMKEFGEGNGVVYVDRPEAVLSEAVRLAGNGQIKIHGERARRFVESYSWDKITDDFEKILEKIIREKTDERLPKRI
jgi:glycosyltransferase involved in cell wall biosynthesis